MSKTILAFDSSMSNCSISLLYKNYIYNNNRICNKNQTKYILPMIQTILKKNSLHLNEIDIIAISKGPGNFIGTRTTIAIAQGLSLGLNIPIIALSTTLIIAEQAFRMFNANRVLIILKINNTEMYVIKYIKNKKNYWNNKKSKRIFNIEETVKILYTLKQKWIVIGNNLELFSENIYKNLIFKHIDFPKSEFIISLYLSHKRYRKHTTFHTILPIYFKKILFK
ncbi:MAG: tRNA (adenosine(37)-N6)-threonylcarbamoyltransferase complex dimerization subunit type 1 TsaB [Buchnera aphidicola (Schlechtendalia peitan)]